MSKAKREYALDALKVFCTIIILFHHYQQNCGNAYTLIKWFGGSFNFSYIVELFFIVSGYFAFHTVTRGTGRFGSFMGRKFLRFFPVMAVTAVADQGARLIYQLILKQPYDQGLSLWGLITSAFGVQDGGVFLSHAVNNPTWYINCLLICYAVLYLLSWISKKMSVCHAWLYLLMVLVGAGAITYGVNRPFLTNHTARAYLGFFLGICLALIMQYKPIQKSKLLSCGCAAYLCGVLFLWFFARSTIKSDFYFLMVFTVFPCILILFRTPLIQKIFSHQFWEILGGIAFNTYMWHAVVIILLNFCKTTMPAEVYYSRIGMLIYTGVCFVLGTLSYHLLDKPSAAFIRKLQTEQRCSTATT